MTARRAEQTRRLANRTHTKTLHKPHAAQRPAISRCPQGKDAIDREDDVAGSALQNRSDRAVGCMAMLGCLLASMLAAKEMPVLFVSHAPA